MVLTNLLSCCCVSPRGPTALPLPLTKISRCFCIVRLFSYQRFKYFHFWLNISAQDKTYNLDFFEQLSKSMSVTTDKNTDNEYNRYCKVNLQSESLNVHIRGNSSFYQPPCLELFIHGTFEVQ